MPDVPGSPDGGFYAAPLPPHQQAYGPPTPWGPAAVGPARQTEAPPPSVVAAVTSLVIAGIAASWLGLSMLTLVSTFGGDGGSGVGLRGAVLLLNGVIDLVLVLPLLRGVEQARWALTGVCAWWVLYWLYQVTRATQAFSDIGLVPAGFGFGQLSLMATLGLLLLAAWAAATVALVWRSDATRHFTGTT